MREVCAIANSHHIVSDEIWKPIPDFPGYEVSNQGRVRSFLKRMGRGRNGGCYVVILDKPQRMLTPQVGHPGRYLHITLRKNNKWHHIRIHKLVLLAFVGPCPQGMVACHNDGNSFNNHLSNLRWDTISNNCKDTVKHGRFKTPFVKGHNYNKKS